MGLLHLVGFLFFYFFYMPRTCWWATLSKNVWCMERPRKRVHCCLARSTTWLRYSLSLRLNSDALINFSFLFFPPKQHSSITWTACPTMWWRYRCKEGSFFVCFFLQLGQKASASESGGWSQYRPCLLLPAAVFNSCNKMALFEKSGKNCSECHWAFKRCLCLLSSLYLASNASCICM